jgi:hypothetical protein
MKETSQVTEIRAQKYGHRNEGTEGSATQAKKSPVPMAIKLVEAPAREQMNPHERKFRP